MSGIISVFTSFFIAFLYLITPSIAAELEVYPPYYVASLKADKYILPILQYEYSALEPFIERATLIAHYKGHHENYRLKMNTALQEWRQAEPDNVLAKESIMTILRRINEVNEAYRTKIINSGGGYVNHAFYWALLSPNPNQTESLPSGKLADDITATFGSLSDFKNKFNTEALNLFGSGYVWLVRGENNALSIMLTKNQDSPLSVSFNPLLVIDVWEHAYYLKHQYHRNKYVDDWWQLVDWKKVALLDEFWKKIAKDFRKQEL